MLSFSCANGASVFYHDSPSVSCLRKRELTVSNVIFLFSLRMSHTHMVYFDHNHPLSTTSFQISTPYLLLPLLFLILFHWVHLVLPLCAWVWGHPVECRKPARSHVPNKENLFSLPEAINCQSSSDGSGASEAPSVLEFLLLWSCDEAGIVTAVITWWSFAGNPSCCRLTGATSLPCFHSLPYLWHSLLTLFHTASWAWGRTGI